MWVYAIGSFAITLFNVLLWVFTLTKSRLSPLAKAYFWWSFYITLWSFGYGLTLGGFFNYEITLLINKWCQAMATLIGPFFFRFASQVAEEFERQKKIYTFYLWFGLINAIVLFVTPYYVKELWSFGVFRYQTLGGPLYAIFTSFFFWCTIHSFIVVAKKYRKLTGVKKKQAQIFLLGTGIAYSGGGELFLQGYGIPIPPYGVFLILAYVVIIAYGIHKYHFLDLPELLKRTVVFAGLVAFVLGVFSFGLFVAQDILALYFGFKWEAALAISIFLIVLGYEPMRAFLIETTDKYLFQKKYDYQKFLRDASRGIAQIESLHHLLGLVTHFITSRMRLNNAAVLMRDPKTRRFYLSYQRGYPRDFKKDFALSEQSNLINYLNHEKEAVEIEQIRDYAERGGKKHKRGEATVDYDFKEIKREMEELRVACCIPSFLGGELRNILVLGSKKSGDYYTHDEINVLFTLAQESAIAIENARLYDEAINRSSQLQKINEELELARRRLSHALQETEKANKELLNTQAQLIHEQKMATLGRLAASVGHEVNNPLTILSMNVSRALLKYRKDPNLKVTEILDLFEKMEQNVGRIKAVVNTLTGLLKKSEKGKFEPLSLKLILEETLPLVQFQTYLDNPTGTEVEFDIPSSVPLIRGDLERLQEVFLNLFINAYHAMSGRRNRKIIVRARLSSHDQRMVEVDFADNGCGMSEEIQKKIFTYGFTTKGPGRGSGMGLYMCKYIIELHGGGIKVKSQPGVGTTFSLTVPAFIESAHTGVPGGVGYSIK